MKKSYKKMIFSALFTAIIAVSAQIILPLPSGVPMTLQTLAIAICGYVLGVKYAVCSTLVYLLLGFFGVPVFAGLTAGAGVLFEQNGGFLIGFIFLSICCGIAANRQKKIAKIMFGILGIILTHTLGCAQFSLVYGNSFLSAFIVTSLPFLAKDIISVIAAVFIADTIKNKSLIRSL